MSPSSRLRLAMLAPKASLTRSSRYQVMCPSSCSMNPLTVMPMKLLLRKDPCLGLLKNPSAAALSGPRTFTFMGSQVRLCSLDADPFGPQVVAAAVGVDDGMPRPREWHTRPGTSRRSARHSGWSQSSRPPASRRSSRSSAIGRPSCSANPKNNKTPQPAHPSPNPKN